MKQVIFIFFLSTVTTFSQDTWQIFSPAEDGFEVMVPGKMEHGLKHVLTDLGEMKTTTWLYKGENVSPDPIFIINISEYPEGVLEADSTELIEDFFETSIKVILQKLEGDLVYQADISTWYNPRKIYKINYNKGEACVKGKMMISGNRFYSIQAFSSFQKSTLPEIDHFLESFTLISAGETSPLRK